jgi:hypothetical protein
MLCALGAAGSLVAGALLLTADPASAMTRPEGLRQSCKKMGGAFAIWSDSTTGRILSYDCVFVDDDGHWEMTISDEP